MMYADTDSAKAMKTKLNSLYGRTAMLKHYILIHEVDRPVVIFKEHISAIEKKANGKAEIHIDNGELFTSDEDYATVVKLMF